MKEIEIFARDLMFLYFFSLPAWAASLQTLTAVALHPVTGVVGFLILFSTGSDFSHYALVHLILFMGMWTCIFTYQFGRCCYWIDKV